MTKLRKIFVVSVMFVTVLSMSVVAAPAGAAAQAGDLIKMDGNASVYYLGADGKRYVFPNETTYFSWYADFSSVVTIPQSELESYPLGKNVTVRPGTKLVKITTDPKVYAVEPGGSLVHVPDEATAIALWGDNWSQRVVDVPDGFFTNYDVAEGQEVSADAYPAGSLVKWSDSADVYYIAEDGSARKVASEAAFEANRFNWDDVVAASDDIAMPTAGDDITTPLAGITDAAAGSGGQAGAGTGVTIALAGDTAASMSLPSYASLIPFVTVNVTASNDGDVTVNKMVFTRGGTGQTDDFDGGYLFIGDSRLTTKRSVNSSDNTITFTAMNLNIPAGKTKAVTLKMNAKTSSTVSGSHSFYLAGQSAIMTNGAVVNGSFPVTGNIMAFSSAAGAAKVILAAGGGTSSLKVGETNVVLDEFTIQNTNQSGLDGEVVEIVSINLKQEGSAGNDAVNNLSLYLDDELVVENVTLEDKFAKFVLDTPFELGKSKTISATIRGDVITDINKNVQFYLKNVADVDVRGTAYGDFYSALITNNLTTGTGQVTTIQGSDINASFDGPSTSDIKDDQDDVVLANFKIAAEDQNVNIETLPVTITYGNTCDLADILTNVELIDEGNNISYSVSDASATTTVLSFENIYLSAGTQYNFEIQGDVPDNGTTGCTYTAGINFNSGFDARFQDDDETAVSVGSDMSTDSLSGKTMTIATPAVSFSKVTTNSSTVVKEATGVLLFKGAISASNVDDLKISKVNFTAYNTGGASQTLSNDYSRLIFSKIEADQTETELDTETSLGGSTVSFSGFTLNVLKGTSNVTYVTVRGNVKNSPTATTTKLAWTGNGTGVSLTGFTVKDSDNNSLATGNISGDVANAGHVTTVASKGTYTMAFDLTETGLNKAQNVLAGGLRKLGKIKITAQKETAIIEDLLIIASSTDLTNYADNTDLAKVYLFEDANMTQPIANVVLGSSNIAVFQDINYEVSTLGVKYIYVAGLIKGIDYSSSPAADSTATAGKNIKLSLLSAIPSTSYTTKLIGKDTGETLTNTSVLNTTTYTNNSKIMGATVSSIDVVSLTDTLLNDGWKTVYKFKITAPESMNVDWDGDPLAVKLASTTLTINASTGVGFSGAKVKRVGGSTYTAVEGTNLATSSTSVVINFSDLITTSADLEVTPGETGEFEVMLNITGVTSNKSFQAYINNADNDLEYTHNTGDQAGNQTADATPVNPLLSTTDYMGSTLTSN